MLQKGASTLVSKTTFAKMVVITRAFSSVIPKCIDFVFVFSILTKISMPFSDKGGSGANALKYLISELPVPRFPRLPRLPGLPKRNQLLFFSERD